MTRGFRRLTGVTWCVAAVLAVSPAAAATISVQPVNLLVGELDTFSLDIQISDAVDLYAFQFDIGFDPTILSATGTTEGPFLATGGATFFIPGAIDNAAGTISFTANSLLTAPVGVNGSGTLVSLQFESIAKGASAVTIFNAITLDSSLSGLVDTIQNGSVTVSEITVIPEPGGFLLFGAASLTCGVAGMRRRRLLNRSPAGDYRTQNNVFCPRR